MTTPDRTDELVRGMLERRVGPVPVWLLDTTMRQVASAGQARGGAWGGLWGRAETLRAAGRRPALVAALVLLLVLLVGVALAAGGLQDLTSTPEPTKPAVVVIPTEAPPATVRPSAPAATTQSPKPAPTPPVVLDVLGPDTVAVVTKEGDRLRVRTAPGVGEDSLKLEPLLPAGTQLFIVDGPVTADGYDWYEVQPEFVTTSPFGWVASGKGDVAWIEPLTPACAAVPDVTALATLTAFEFLHCYGSHSLTIVADTSEVLGDPNMRSCALGGGRSGCVELPDWLLPDEKGILVDLNPERGRVDSLPVFFSPDSFDALQTINMALPMLLTGSVDAPEAAECRITDADGQDLAPRDAAILRCRLRFVVDDVRPAAGAETPPAE
jgi:hypothetical protein